LYVERVLAFNDRVDQVRRDNERELLAIEARKQRNMANADGLRIELQRAFRELESTVKEGRSRIESEQSRQLRVRQSNLQSLQAMLNELRRQHAGEVEGLVSKESTRMSLEGQWYLSERKKLMAERNAALFLAKSRPVPETLSSSAFSSSNSSSPGSSKTTSAIAGGRQTACKHYFSYSDQVCLSTYMYIISSCLSI
jgi:hypothetical protein